MFKYSAIYLLDWRYRSECHCPVSTETLTWKIPAFDPSNALFCLCSREHVAKCQDQPFCVDVFLNQKHIIFKTSPSVYDDILILLFVPLELVLKLLERVMLRIYRIFPTPPHRASYERSNFHFNWSHVFGLGCTSTSHHTTTNSLCVDGVAAQCCSLRSCKFMQTFCSDWCVNTRQDAHKCPPNADDNLTALRICECDYFQIQGQEIVIFKP